jgi:hypothetical protein
MAQLAEEAQAEKDAFERVKADQLRAAAARAADEAATNAEARRHAGAVRAQIGDKEAVVKAAKAAALADAAKAKAEAAAEVARIEAARQRKLQELQAAGIPAKYMAELAKKKGPQR